VSDRRIESGIYQELLTRRLLNDLIASGRFDDADITELRVADAADRLSLHAAQVLARVLDALPDDERVAQGAALLSSVLRLVDTERPEAGVALDDLEAPPRLLDGVRRRQPDGSLAPLPLPLTPVADTTVLTNARGEPRVQHELLAEIPSADRVDVIMAFIRWSGVRPFLDTLRRHLEDGGTLRVLTTTYTNSTESRALDALTDIGANVRVSYDLSTTRLHAKAWIFHRSRSATTAYIGSSNLTHSAMVTGLEWNVRLSARRNPDAIAKMAALFETYWESRDFVPYDRGQFQARTTTESGPGFVLPPTDIVLRPFQERLLEQIEVARAHGHHRNLLVAATGTGKTVMAAVDYVRLRQKLPRARLLFVAHRREILEQSRATFRHALRDASFGELWVGGSRPERFDAVFASIQGLSAAGLRSLDPTHFDVVVVDEFHHATAPTYEALLEHVRPVELLGLTATPERSDGLDVLRYFDGRIAAELRVWDAIDQQYLVPFTYYGISDGMDLSEVPWRRGRGYDTTALTNVYTADDLWAGRVLGQLRDKVGDPRSIRAIGFCVSIAHAQFMADFFRRKGVEARAVWGDSPADERRQALRDLAEGNVAVLFTVDLFNEGIDVPTVDTLLLLRPTESATLFLQQLGRGLRRSPGKSECTVLDFVGHHRREFRFDLKYRALLGGTRRELEQQIEHGVPFLPAGCHFDLDPVARSEVLRSIRNAIPTRWPERVAELRAAGNVGLATFLAATGLDLDDLYANNRSWSELRRAADLPTAPPGPDEPTLLRAVGRLLHVDDDERIEHYRAFASATAPLTPAAMNERERRLLRMFLASMLPSTRETSLEAAHAQLLAHPQVCAEIAELMSVLSERVEHLQPPLATNPDAPLHLHARYTRIEIQAALNDGSAVRPPRWDSGVKWLPGERADVFAFTLDKTSGAFSPTTRYRDYAISPELIHWETQSVTSVASPTGQRYLNHVTEGTTILLFARLRADERAFWFLGPATYVRHEGDRPIAITWRLHERLPADLFSAFAAAIA
jgi:superfamily II DNA or RNA helicase